MRNWTMTVVLTVAMMALVGCSITIGGGGGGRTHDTRADAVTLTEIDTAVDLMLESDRERALKNIAARPQLSANAQVYLVDVALDELMMESSRRSVVKTMINNPGFVQEAKMRILEKMDAFMLESSRRDVMDQLNRRGHVPSGREVEILIEPAQDDNAVQMETTIQTNYSTQM